MVKKNKELMPLRIAFVSYEYPPETISGGIGTYTKQIASLLASNKIDVHVFAGSNIQSGKVSENGVTVHRVCSMGAHDFQKNVLSYFEEEHIKSSFNLIESAEIHANALAIKIRFPKIPLIVRLHASNWLVESFKKKYMPLQYKLRFLLGALRRGRWDLGYWRNYDFVNDADYCYLKLADFITAPTNQMKKWAVENWRLDPNCIKVLENPFVENEAFKLARTSNEEHAIIFYGRLNVLKGLITATKAMKLILMKNPAWKWIIIGEDGNAADGKTSMKEWMQKELKGLMSQVIFYDTVAHGLIPFYLKQSSIVLIPSLFESYSYVTIEAMIAGKAVIGSYGTGIESLIENNVTGILVDPYKSGDWVKTIQKLINNTTLRQGLGKAAYEYADQKDMCNKSIIAYYKGMVTEKNKH
jgi:glycosyltransferase involved in cell wall biosynthesis